MLERKTTDLPPVLWVDGQQSSNVAQRHTAKQAVLQGPDADTTFPAIQNWPLTAPVSTLEHAGRLQKS